MPYICRNICSVSNDNVYVYADSPGDTNDFHLKGTPSDGKPMIRKTISPTWFANMTLVTVPLVATILIKCLRDPLGDQNRVVIDAFVRQLRSQGQCCSVLFYFSKRAIHYVFSWLFSPKWIVCVHDQLYFYIHPNMIKYIRIWPSVIKTHSVEFDLQSRVFASNEDWFQSKPLSCLYWYVPDW